MDTLQSAKTGKILTFAPGETLFRQGEVGGSFYIIKEGTVELFVLGHTEETEVHLGTCQAGEILGELSIINHLPRNATARALSPVTAVEVNVADYDKVVTELPSWVQSFISSLARKIQSANNRVTEEYLKALNSAVENARMGKELQIAKAVQDTLFPKSEHQFQDLDVVGYYQSASECGGDWWYVSETEGKIIFWMGDATGHGVSAALITSAARAVASVLEQKKVTQPKEILKTLNRAISETSKGQVMMTFFVASYDKKSHMLTYSNASHEIPFLIRQNRSLAQASSPKLVDVPATPNPRLGEAADHEFCENVILIQPRDSMLIYSDGVTNLENPGKRPLGERKLLKLFEGATHLYGTASQITESLRINLVEYQENAKLVDDVTLMVLRRNR